MKWNKYICNITILPRIIYYDVALVKSGDFIHNQAISF